MDKDLKERIAEGLRNYVENKGLSQESFAQLADMNVAYVNAILKNEFVIVKTPIKDSYFKAIADVVGIETEKSYIDHVNTPQFMQIYSELLDAKVTGRVKMIIAPTGVGKTYTVNKFLQDHPSQTHRITLSSLYNMRDVLAELDNQLNVGGASTKHVLLKKMATRLWMKRHSGQPIIIFDEAENANVPTLKMLKAFYDEANKYCSIVLIGTPQLLNKLNKMRDKDVDGMAQFHRRFKAGIREVAEIDKRRQFAPFLDKIDDQRARTLITSLSDNYGELTDFLGHALREADRMGLPLTEGFFRKLFGLEHK